MQSAGVHLFEINGQQLVLDVESDTLHRVDNLAAEVISLLDDGYSGDSIPEILAGRYPRWEAAEAVEEVEGLRNRGLLWARAEERPGAGKPAVKALCLNVAHTCNLSCRYCFAAEGSYGQDKGLMTADVGRSAIDFLLENSNGRKRLEVDYFGGEPLLNLDVVKEVTDYARRRGEENGVEFGFTLTTNGLLLNKEVAAYLQDEGFSVVLSLDGRPEVHDGMRRFPGGAPSYEAVKDRLLNFLHLWGGSYYYVRGTYTRYNRDFSRDVAHLADLGFQRISLEPVVADPAEEWALTEEDLPLLNDEYLRLADLYLQYRREGRPFDFFHFAVDLDRGPCVYKRLSGCGAGEEYLAVTPTGDLYPCHQLIGDRSLCLGNVGDRSAFGDKFVPPSPEVFPPAGPLSNQCRFCWARYHCGGGCRAAAKLVNGCFETPNELECALQKTRLECALYIKANT